MRIWASFFLTITILGSSLLNPALAEANWFDISESGRLMKVLTRPQCPPGFDRNRSGTTTYCLVRNLTVPAKAVADCDRLSSGTIGFTLPKKSKAYTCPVGMKQTVRKGLTGCYFSDLAVVKDGPELRPYCAYLGRGYIGFSYHQN